jgi:hypothetical protein
MPVLETRGAASARGYGLLSGQGGSGAVIEDVFSTFVYTGNGSTQTITNGIDLSTQGGLVWMKGRSGATDHALYDTARGATKDLASNTTAAETTQSTGLTAFGTTGFSIGALAKLNTSSATYASWTFRKAPKFFDVVTFTGTRNGSTWSGGPRVINHSLDATPGFIVWKATSTTSQWECWHRSLGNNNYIVLNTTNANAAVGSAYCSATSTNFTLENLASGIIADGVTATFVAYLFAHDAGGFGASGTDNVISCGSYTGNGSSTGPTVTLGYEPQWLMVKNASGTGNWNIIDNMRGMPVGSADAFLEANTSNAEASTEFVTSTATGFQIASTSSEVNTNSSTYIYVAIRRGPMRTPTSGTSVFAPSARSGTGATGSSTALGNVTDLAIIKQRGSTQTWAWTDRLRGAANELTSAATTGETTYSNDVTGFDSMTGFAFGSGASGQVNSSGSTYIDYLLRRAPGFFDVVCYTGDGTAGRLVTHNLKAAPELIIIKRRDSWASNWAVYSQSLGVQYTVYLNLSSAANFYSTGGDWNQTAPTASNFTLGSGTGNVNFTGSPEVAYLFATVAGISKVGSYTGNGSSQTINCGFTGGARFVLIKATSTTGDWLVADSARGIIAGNDPYLELNTTNAEVTGEDWLDTDSTGFVVNEVSGSNANTNGVSYIFLAVA